MKKTFKLVGLDCANCAAKIENAVQKISGVTSANVNFMTTKMVIEGDDSKMDDIIAEATAIVKKLEPDVEVKKA
ncbi:cation transporter [Sedimentibacter sp.]|uniref:cation transporter n=1 Tax=Sedimentibacter sp. TaxID=1960295 RepID=UPI00289D8152|nr:cation transporter [Sedimentibacter sp.]